MPPQLSPSPPPRAVIGVQFNTHDTDTSSTTDGFSSNSSMPPPKTTSSRTSSNYTITSNTTTAATMLQLARHDGYQFITCRIPNIPQSSSQPHVATTSTTTTNATAAAVSSSSSPPPTPPYTTTTSNATMTDTTTTTTTTTTSTTTIPNATTLTSQDWRTSIVGILMIDDYNISSSSSSSSGSNGGDQTADGGSVLQPQHQPQPQQQQLLLLQYLTHKIQSSIGWCLHMNLPVMILPSLEQIMTLWRTTIIITTTTMQSSFDVSQHQRHICLTHYANILLSSIIATTMNIRDLQIWIPYYTDDCSGGTTTTMTDTTITTTNSALSSFSDLRFFYQLLDYHPSIHTLYTLSSSSSSTSSSTSGRVGDEWQQQQMSVAAAVIQRQVHIEIGSLPPIACIQLPTHVFLTNKRGFPTVSVRYHQMILIMLYRRLGRNLKLLVTQTMDPLVYREKFTKLFQQQQQQVSVLGSTLLLPHYQYLQHFRSSKPEITSILDTDYDAENDANDDSNQLAVATVRRWEAEAYNDVLQSPLQPLADHLENYTYEIFEQDPIKYVQYQTAIYHTLLEYYNSAIVVQQTVVEATTMPQQQQHQHNDDTATIMSSLSGSNPSQSSSSSSSTGSSGSIIYIPYIVLVVGAGRGPLVTCTINAYQEFCNTICPVTTTTTTTSKQQQQQQATAKIQLQLYIYAVEKNPNAILYLQSKFDTMIHMNDPNSANKNNIRLQIVQSDLRFLNGDTLFQNIVTDHQQQQQQQQQSRATTATASQQQQQPAVSSPRVVSASSYKANLIVSELLGSFGCNELSPECLDTLLHCTNNVCSSTMTRSIPYRYTSHIAPISSMKLYHKMKQQSLYPTTMDATQQQVIGFLKAYETPYVVRPYVASQIYTTQDCWSFTHQPSSSLTTTMMHDNNIMNHERYVHLEFPAVANNTNTDTVNHNNTDMPFMYGAQYGSGYGPCDDYVQGLIGNSTDGNTPSQQQQQHYRQSVQQPPHPLSSSSSVSWTCTGLIGTFTADLYSPGSSSTHTSNMKKSSDDNNCSSIQISTNPNTFSKGMFSWFPIYFPCCQPIIVPEHGTLHVDVWRKCNATKVWYEWLFTVTVEVTTTSSSTAPTLSSTTSIMDQTNNNCTTTTVNAMEMDINDDDATNNDPTSSNNTAACTVTAIVYMSPIHNPGGRSSSVSLL